MMTTFTQELIKSLGTVVCITSLMLPVIISAIIGIRGWKPFIARIRQKQQEGKFKEWNKPPVSNRVRLLILICLISVVFIMAGAIAGAFMPTLFFSKIGVLVFLILGLALLTASILLYIMVLKK